MSRQASGNSEKSILRSHGAQLPLHCIIVPGVLASMDPVSEPQTPKKDKGHPGTKRFVLVTGTLATRADPYTWRHLDFSEVQAMHKF